VTCFIIINQLVLWHSPVNYSISRRQGSTSNRKHSVLRHQLSGTLCVQLQKVPLPSLLSRHIWKCSLLHTTRSNISSAAGASDSSSGHTAQPINIFDIWHLNICWPRLILLRGFFWVTLLKTGSGIRMILQQDEKFATGTKITRVYLVTGRMPVLLKPLLRQDHNYYHWLNKLDWLIDWD